MTSIETAAQSFDEMNNGGGCPIHTAISDVRTETDREIAAVELGLSLDASWGRIDRVAAADNVASPKNYR